MEKGNNNFLGIVLALVIGLAGGYFLQGGLNAKMETNSDQQGASNVAPVVKESTNLASTSALNTTVYANPNCSGDEYFVQNNCYKADQILSNSKNKFDNIGVEHNQGVSYVLNALSNKKVITSTDIQNAISQYEKSKGVTVDVPAILNSVDLSNPDFAKLSTSAQAYATKMRAISSESVKTNYDAFITVENQIMLDTKLTTGAKEALLSAASTGRYSQFFWATTNYNGGTIQGKFWKIFGADLLGALLGTATGGPLGGVIIGMGASIAAGAIASDK